MFKTCAGRVLFVVVLLSAFAYPAFFALPFVPLLALPPIAQRSLWWFANLTLLASIIWIVANMVWPVVCRRRGSGRAPVWLSVLVIAILSGHLVEGYDLPTT